MSSPSKGARMELLAEVVQQIVDVISQRAVDFDHGDIVAIIAKQNHVTYDDLSYQYYRDWC